jgi:hypothetical protein
MEHSPTPIQLTLGELQANYLLASLTDEEKAGIQSSVNSDGLTVLTLPPSFSWVSVPPAPGPSYLKRLHLATAPNGAARIQVVFNAQNEIVEVNVL